MNLNLQKTADINFSSQLSNEVQNFNRALLAENWQSFDQNTAAIKFENNALIFHGFTENQTSLINSLLQVMPEWQRLIGGNQHHIHDFTLDIHTISVVKYVFSNPKFLVLSENYKLLMLYSALMHDLEKNTDEIDPEHPVKSSKKSSIILFRLGFDEKFIENAYLLIKYHQLPGYMVSGKVVLSDEEISSMYKNPDLVELQMILSIADVKSVKKHEGFYPEGLDLRLEELKAKIISLLN